MKNYYELIPGDAKQYQLIPGNSDHYRLIPGQPSKFYDLMSAKGLKFPLLLRRRGAVAGLEPHDYDLLRRKISEIRQVTEAGKSATDQLSALYLYIENRLMRALAAVETTQLQHDLSEESAHIMDSVHTFLTRRFLQRVLTLFESKSNTILATLAPDVPFMKGDDCDELHRD